MDMDNGRPFLRNLWHFALHSDKLRKGRLYTKELLGEKIAFGRDPDGRPFALKDNCPHRGVPLSEGTFDGQTIRCCYHGWVFDCTGTCQKNPKLMLLGDPDAQARWYFELKKTWRLALEQGTEFLHPLKSQTLRWIT